MKKRILLFILLFFPLFFTPNTLAYAETDFSSTYRVTYEVNSNLETIVTQNIELTNNTSESYPKEYILVVNSPKIRDIIARDSIDIISPKISINQGKTTITLPLNEKQAGIGKKTNISLRYVNDTIAQKIGSIYEILIPGIGTEPEISSYSATLRVDDSLGIRAFIKPKPHDGVSWNTEQLRNGGILAMYGQKQTYGFILRYTLKNISKDAKQFDIPIPPDTDTQQTIYHSLLPYPDTVKADADGNWIASYTVPPFLQKTITADVTISVLLNVIKNSNFSDVLTVHTENDRFVESDDDTITEIGKKLFSPLDIYNFTKNTLQYDKSREELPFERFGAKKALNEKSHALCSEFTDVFIALSRTKGIPARRIVGYAFSDNSNTRPVRLSEEVLHAWPEYFDPSLDSWIQVDPTWDQTSGGLDYFQSLDFNHVVFVRQGVNSDSPLPPGFYRGNKIGQDISVSFPIQSEEESENAQKPKLQAFWTWTHMSFVNVIQGIPPVIRIRNTGGSTLSSFEILQTEYSKDDVKIEKSIYIDRMLPFDTIPILPIESDTLYIQLSGLHLNYTYTRYHRIAALSIIGFSIVSGIFLCIIGFTCIWKKQRKQKVI